MKTSALIALLLVAGACKHTSDNPVPRREAYPRVNAYDAAYATPAGLPTDFQTNANATSTVERRSDGNTWLTVSYPAYNAKAYITFTPASVDELDDIIDNRTQRIALNFGSAGFTTRSFVSRSGYQCTLTIARGSVSTPIQFLAISNLSVSSEQMVISGSIFFDNPGSTEQMAPFIELLTKDMAHALDNL